MFPHMNSRPVRVYAVTLDGEGWVGVGADVDRCRGHEHDTPELAKLCALHRMQPGRDNGRVVLLPLGRDRRRRNARAFG